jgi:hypothetical protein
MPKRRLRFNRKEVEQAMQAAREHLPEDVFHTVQQIVTSYARLVSLVGEGTTPIGRLREMFKIASQEQIDVGHDHETKRETPQPPSRDGAVDG